MFKKTKVGGISLITKQKLYISLAITLGIGLAVCLVLYNLISHFAAQALASNESIGNVTVENINFLTATYAPSLIAIMGGIVPVLFALLLVVKYLRSLIVTKTTLKDFNLYFNSKDEENRIEKTVLFRILADYCRKLKIIDHPNDDLHLMSQSNADKYRSAKSRFMALIKDDREVANISTLDFANLDFPAEKKAKIDKALLGGVNG